MNNISKWVSRSVVTASVALVAVTVGCGDDDPSGENQGGGTGGKAMGGTGGKAMGGTGGKAMGGTAMGGTGGKATGGMTMGGMGGDGVVGGMGGAPGGSGQVGGEAGSGGGADFGGAGGGAGDSGVGGAGGDGGGAGGAGGGAAVNNTVKINEVRSEGVDFVELFNTGAAIDISGWYFTDADPTHIYTYPAATTFGAGAFLAVEKDNPVDFEFGLGGVDSVILHDADGNVVDRYDWLVNVNTASRCPDGTGAFVTGKTQTQGLANSCL